MTYLIDTHILIWYVTGDSKLKKNFVGEIKNRSNRILVSKVSLWEIAIKVSLGKLSEHYALTEFESYLTQNSFEILDFDTKDLQQLLQLPFHHRDPFDRLIISQAITGNFTIITDDSKFQFYPVQLLKNE